MLVMNAAPRLSYAQLVDLAEGRLSEPERADLLARLAADPLAAAELAWLERVIGLMRDDTGEDAPDYVVNRALRLFRPPPAPLVPGLLRRVVALLRFDSAQAPLAMGLRAGPPAVRQLLFNAAGRDLDLRLVPAGEQWQIIGQVLGPDDGGFVVLQGQAGAFQAELNELSEFTLPPAPPGRYTLTLRQADLEIVVTDLELGPSAG